VELGKQKIPSVLKMIPS